MGQHQILEFAGVAADAAVARCVLTVEAQLQRNHPSHTVGGIHKAAGSQLAEGNGTIARLRVTALNHEGNRLANHTVKHRAVVGAATHQINKVASRQRCGIAIHFDCDVTTTGAHEHGGLPLQAGSFRICTTASHLSAGGGAAAHHQGQEQQQGPENETTHGFKDLRG